MFKLKFDANLAVFPEFDNEYKAIVEDVYLSGLSMAMVLDFLTTMNACRHVAKNDIAGDFVECGVWKGGNSIAAKKVFELEGCKKQIHCFDTFLGMVKPGDKDFSLSGHRSDAQAKFSESDRGDHVKWAYSNLDEVKENFILHGGLDGVTFCKGDVRETLLNEDNLPESISVLRLDTDWYESTKIELEVLYPRLSVGGVLLIDDYAVWNGQREAVDEYFSSFPKNKRPMLQIVSEQGRSAIKL